MDDPEVPVPDPADLHHLLRVLRIRPGELVVAADGRGAWTICRLGEDDQGRLLEPVGPLRREPVPEPTLTVAFAPVKGERPEWVVQKLTEIGVDRIVPLRTDRSVVRWEGGRGHQSVERLRRIAREAAAQSRRTFLPEVTDVQSLDELARAYPGGGGPWLADPSGGPLSAEVTVVAVGPEGGWSEAERATLPRVSLGTTILRSETAAIVAGAYLAGLRSGLLGLSNGPRPSLEGRVGVPEST